MSDDRTGWATRTIDHAVQQASLGGIGGWQVVLLLSVLVSPVTISRPLLVGLHLLAAVACWASTLGSGRVWMVGLGATYAVLAVDVHALDGWSNAYALAVVWTAILCSATPVLIVRGRAMVIVPVVLCSFFGIELVVAQPDWPVRIAVAQALAGLAFAVGSAGLIRVMRRLSTKVDQESREMERERDRLAVARHASEESVEDARVLHDTVINTLCAVAAGGAAVSDVGLVRARAAQDLRIVERLMDGVRDERVRLRTGLGDLRGPTRIRRQGLSEDDADQLLTLLPPRRASALQGAVQEAVRNAAKHAGVDVVTVEVRGAADQLVVSVVDEGRGFLLDEGEGLGLRESVLGRCRSAGIRVEVWSMPGEGTRVTFEAPFVDDGDVPETPRALSVAYRFRRRICWTWALAITTIGVLYEAINGLGAFSWGYPMLVLVAGTCALGWWTCRDGGSLPAWLVAVAVLVVPVGLVMAFAAIDFGRGNVTAWQGVALTPVLVLLMIMTPRRTPLLLAQGLLVLTTAVCCLAVGRSDPGAAAVIAIAAGTQLGQFAGCLTLAAAIDGLAERFERDRAAARAAHNRAEALDAVTLGRRRWSASSLSVSAGLLRDLRDGAIAPDDPRVQADCAAEEGYLRQLVLVAHESVFMTSWFTLALAQAKSRSVELTVRSGSADAADETVAVSLGRTVVDAVEAVPAGSELIVSLFGDGETTRLMLVGPPHVVGLADLVTPPPGWSIRPRRLGAQGLVEVVSPVRQGVA